MKIRISPVAPFLLLCLGLVITQAASAQILYSDGPINGHTDGWTINFGFVVSDTFILSSPNNTVTGMSFGAWLFPGDVLESVEVSFTHFEFGGTTYFDQVVNFTASNCFLNNYGYDVCQETGMFNVSLPNGTYWMNLENAVVNNGDPVYWDENSGPSSSSENEGTLPAESFSILGTSSSTVPEPGSMLLFASGVVAITGILRRKIF